MMSTFNRILSIHNKLVDDLSMGREVDQNSVSLLIDLIRNGNFTDLSERQFLRSCLVFWNSSVDLAPLPEKESYEQEDNSDTLIKRRQAKPEQVKPTYFDKLSWRK